MLRILKKHSKVNSEETGEFNFSISLHREGIKDSE